MLIRMKQFTEEVAARVRAELAAQQKTVTGLSLSTGISTKTLSRRLSGKSSWTTSEIVAVADHLGVSINSLMDVPSAKIVTLPKKEVDR